VDASLTVSNEISAPKTGRNPPVSTPPVNGTAIPNPPGASRPNTRLEGDYAESSGTEGDRPKAPRKGGKGKKPKSKAKGTSKENTPSTSSSRGGRDGCSQGKEEARQTEEGPGGNTVVASQR
jgi:hypothetical protein